LFWSDLDGLTWAKIVENAVSFIKDYFTYGKGKSTILISTSVLTSFAAGSKYSSSWFSDWGSVTLYFGRGGASNLIWVFLGLFEDSLFYISCIRAS
jgi:hypothetical protein